MRKKDKIMNRVIGDEPITEFKYDEFNISRYVEAMCSLIRTSKTPITISIQGEWGSGKSSFMKLVSDTLSQEKNADKVPRYCPIVLHMWDLFLENSPSAATSKLIMDLIRQMGECFADLYACYKLNDFKDLGLSLLKDAASAFANHVNMKSEYAEKVMDVLLETDNSKSIAKAKKKLENYITETFPETTFLVFVDDLDRLNPEMAVTLMEALKNLFDIKQCVFILAVDYEVVVNGVRKKYSNMDFENRSLETDFFDKLVQIPFVVPMAQYDIEKMCIRYLEDALFYDNCNELRTGEYHITAINIITLATRKNPRSIKRLMNMAKLCRLLEDEDIAKDSVAVADVRIMQLLLLSLQMAFPKIYRKLYSLNISGINDSGQYRGEATASISEENIRAYELHSELKRIIFKIASEDPVSLRNIKRILALIGYYEIYSKKISDTGSGRFIINKIMSGLAFMDITGNEETANYFDADAYSHSSQTQSIQGSKMIAYLKDLCPLTDFVSILDVGCGSGQTTFSLWKENFNAKIKGIDINSGMVEKSKELFDENLSAGQIPLYAASNYSFDVMDGYKIRWKNRFDLVFSNATMHWLTDSEKAYKKLYDALIPGGVLAVHQGGNGTYAGLHAVAREAAVAAGLAEKIIGWKFPAFYPSEPEMIDLLENAGFEKIQIECEISSETDNKTLIDNFAKASLPIYKGAGLTDEEFKRLENEYFNICNKKEPDKTSVRLYILAKKPEKEVEQ